MNGSVRRFGGRVLQVGPEHIQALLKTTYVVAILAAADLSIDGRVGSYLPTTDGWVLFTELVVPVPAYVYLYAFFGAGTYVLTSLIFDPKDSTTEVLQLGYRLVAALPLGAGIFLLAAFALNQPTDGGNLPVAGERLYAGGAFIAGLFVRLTLRKLGDVAERLYDLRGEPALPYEGIRRRNEALENLRAAYTRVLDGEGALTTARRDELRGRLRQVEAILDDEDATLQELERARALSEETLGALPATAGAYDQHVVEDGRHEDGRQEDGRAPGT